MLVNVTMRERRSVIGSFDVENKSNNPWHKNMHRRCPIFDVYRYFLSTEEILDLKFVWRDASRIFLRSGRKFSSSYSLPLSGASQCILQQVSRKKIFNTVVPLKQLRLTLTQPCLISLFLFFKANINLFCRTK